MVANPVGAHREMVRDGETGFLATTRIGVGGRAGEAGRRPAAAAVDGPSGPPAGRGELLGLGVGRDVCDVGDGVGRAAASRASWKIDRAEGPTERRKGFEPHLARTGAVPNIQPDRRSMSVCTPQPRTTRPWRPGDSGVTEAPPPEELVRRMFKPPDWQWRQTPGRRLVVSRRLGRGTARAGRAASGRMAGRRACSRP